jgi:hypothetical protein
MALRSSRKWLSSAAVLVVGWIVYTFPPTASAWYPRCLFHTLTGFDCPGCGGTRALHQLLHGNVREAFALNPLLFLLILTVLFAAPSFWRGESPAFFRKPWFGWTSFVVLTSFWIGRNLV